MTRRPDQRGAVLPLVALSLVVLMGFAALAVDIGAGYSEVRTSQNAVDASAMAAAVEVNVGIPDAQNMVKLAVVYAAKNLPVAMTIDDWVDSCPDTARPEDQLEYTAAELGLTPATDCISFSFGFDTIRVSLPERSIDTRFAGALGIDSFDVSAFAHASLHYEDGGSVPPFAVTSGVIAGEERCLRAAAISSVMMPPRWLGNGVPDPASLGSESVAADADPCDASVFDTATEFFGSLRAYSYETCVKPSGNTAIALVIADGIDHRLSSFEPDYVAGDLELIDGDGCAGGKVPQPFPNTIELQTGYTAQLLMLGLLDLDVSTPRLQRGEHVQSNYRFADQDMDNASLWEFLRSDIASVNAPDSCKKVYEKRGDAKYDYFDLKELMIDCLERWGSNPNHDVIFADPDDDDEKSPSITTSGRFAFIPILAEPSLTGLEGKHVHIDSFVPAFINTLYQISKKLSQSPDCWTQHSAETTQLGWSRHQAGQEFDCGIGGSNAQISSVAAIVLACGALPESICNDSTVAKGPGGEPVSIVRLTR